MNIATALNRKYIKYTVVMLLSICENNPEHIDAYLLHCELTEDDISLIRESLFDRDITIIPLKVDRNLFDSALPSTDAWGVEIYFRLLLFDLLPEEVERILYLDVDIIVNKSIQDYYHVDFEDDDVIACIDAYNTSPWASKTPYQLKMFEPMIAKGFQYFNSGVLLFNVASIRKKYNFESYMTAVREWDYKMTSPDQDILNYVHWEKTGYADSATYDLFARRAHNAGLTYDDLKANTCIIHFTGNKPWQAGNIHFDIEKLWWDYARKTRFYQDFLEDFLHDSLYNTFLEDYIKNLLAQNEQTNSDLQKMLEVNNKLMSMLGK